MKQGKSKIKQMKGSVFREEYGIPAATFEMLVNRDKDRHPLPAFKIGGRWYVDMTQFEEWRRVEDRIQRVY